MVKSYQMTIINEKYEIHTKIGNGSFGKVFLGIHLQNKKKIIVKTESLNSYGLLKHETNILYFLSRHHCSNIPSVYWYGNTDVFSDLGPQKCLVMTYFPGKSLDQLREKMTMQEKKQWMYSMISLLEQIHQTGIIHRDIKPAHFILSENGKWNLIDFGLATFFSDEQKRETENSSLTGTPNYISINIHQGFVPNRRDDLISLGYIFLELCLCGREPDLYPCVLPWKNGGISNEWYIEKKNWSFLYTFISEVPFPDEVFPILRNYFQECERWTYESTPSYYTPLKHFFH